jgi:hypothetical protein
MALADLEQKVSAHKGPILAGFAIVGGVVFLWRRHESKKTAAQSSSTGIDPATGYPMGSAADLAALQVLDNQPGTSAYPSSALFGTPPGTGSGGGGGGGGGGGTNPPPRVRVQPGGPPIPAPAPAPPLVTTPTSPIAAAPPAAPAPVTPAIPAATAASTPPVSIPGNSQPNGSTGVAVAKAAGAPFGYTTVFNNGGTTYYGLGNPSELAAATAAGWKITTAKAAGVPGGSTTAKYAYQ